MFTKRECEVLELVAQGLSTKEIAAKLNIAFRTAVCHRCRLREKIGARNTAELIARTAAMRIADPASRSPQNGEAAIARRVQDMRNQGRKSHAMLLAAILEQKELTAQNRMMLRELRELCNAAREQCWEALNSGRPGPGESAR